MPKRILEGVISSVSREKTVTVVVERKFPHPVYGKMMRRKKKYSAHTESQHKIGDHVLIQESRPFSKTKHFEVIENKNNKDNS